jgi:hypothetical protein
MGARQASGDAFAEPTSLCLANAIPPVGAKFDPNLPP